MTAPMPRIRIAFLVLWALHGALSVAFSRTAGLAYDGGGLPLTHARELQSSGGDDDLWIELGVVLAGAAVGWSALRLRRPFGAVDLAANAVLLALQLAFVLAIEQGSIPLTIARDRSWVLALWLATFGALAGCLAIAARRARW